MEETIELTVTHTNDYREGPKLWIVQGLPSDDESGNLEDRDTYGVELTLPDRENYHVFQLSLDLGFYDEKLLRTFTSIEEAILYSKQQFYLFTGEYPFISNGKVTSGYHPMGERVNVETSNIEDEICDITGYGNRYLIIIKSNNEIRSYSLDYSAIWD